MTTEPTKRFNRWVLRGLRNIEQTNGHLVLGGNQMLGAEHLLYAYQQCHEKTISLQLAPLFTAREEFLASVFAQAANESVGWRILPAAVSLRYQVRMLAQRLPDFHEYTIIIRNADYGRLLIEELQQLPKPPRLILECTTPGLVRVKHAVHLDPQELLLRMEEAREIAESRGVEAKATWLRVFTLSGGQYQLFLDNLPYIPGAVIPEWEQATQASEAAPEEVLEVCIAMGRWMDALEVAVNRPEWVPELVQQAGPYFAEEGILDYLKLHLDSLPEPYASDPRVLEWKLICAVKSNTADLANVLECVKKYLHTNKAPSLRARYGGVIGGEEGLKEARKALMEERSPSVLYEVGRLTPDTFEAVNIYREAVERASVMEAHHEFVRNAQQLACRLADRGEYIEAAEWTSRALAVIDENSMMNGTRRRQLIFAMALYRWMVGKSVGMREMVREEANALPPGEDHARFLLMQASMAASHDDGVGAVERLRQFRNLNLPVPAAVSVSHHVQCLLATGEVDEAKTLAVEALADTGGRDDLQATALLAYAATLIEEDPETAERYLREADELLTPGFSITRLQVELYLARATKSTVRDEYRHLFKQVPYTVLRLLGGKGEEFHHIYGELVRAAGYEVFISGLHNGGLYINGEPQRLSKQLLETLVVLALHEDGLTAEELQARLAEDMTSNHVKVIVSRLRKHVPITTFGAYKLDCAYFLDLNEIINTLRRGNVLRVLELVRNGILPWSDAIAISEYRQRLEQELREAVLASSDPEVMAAALEALPNDSVVLEYARTCLQRNPTQRGDTRLHSLGRLVAAT